MKKIYFSLLFYSLIHVFQPLNALKVLLADDEESTRFLLSKLLSQKCPGIEIEEAVDGMDALQKWKPNMYDVVISDNDMPKLGGLEWISKLRQIAGGETQNVLFYTSSAEDQWFQEKAIPLHPMEMFQKGTGLVHLLRMIKELCPSFQGDQPKILMSQQDARTMNVAA